MGFFRQKEMVKECAARRGSYFKNDIKGWRIQDVRCRMQALHVVILAPAYFELQAPLSCCSSLLSLGLENLKDSSTFQFWRAFSFIIRSVKTNWNTTINLNVFESKSPFPHSLLLPSPRLERKPQKPTFLSTASSPLSALSPPYSFLFMSVTSRAPVVQVTPFYHSLILTRLTHIPHPSSKLLAFFQCDSIPILATYPMLPTLSPNVSFSVSFEWKSGSALRTTFLTSLLVSPLVWRWNRCSCSSLLPLDESKNPICDLSLSQLPFAADTYWLGDPPLLWWFLLIAQCQSLQCFLQPPWLHSWWFKYA